MEAPRNYVPVSMGDEDSDTPSESDEQDPRQQNPTRPSATPNVPVVAVSPAPSPPARVATDDSHLSVASPPRSNSNNVVPPQRPPPAPLGEKRRQGTYSSLDSWRARFHGSITPSQHDLAEHKSLVSDAKRQYSHSKQRRRLWRLTIGEFFNTLMLCLAYFGILYKYSKMRTISIPERRIFNSLTTAVSLLLGVNLAASLRSYAKLLRWRMLSICYRPLETFDLVMGCDSLMNVTKLLWKARDHRYKFLPSRTQIICLLWLIVHLAVTVLVGIIGLNYNLDNSNTAVLTRTGNVSIVDLNALSSGFYNYDLAQVQQWGIRGLVTRPLDLSDLLEFQQTYYSDEAGFTQYYFIDQNPVHQEQNVISARYIMSQAYCTGYIVDQGSYGNLSYVTYTDGNKVFNQSLPEMVGPGGLMAISKLNSTCGERCVEMHAFQAATFPSGDDTSDLGYTIPEGTYFICNNTVPQVGIDDNTELSSDYLTLDLVGRMLAGALGWSDTPPAFNGTAEYAVYTNSSRVSFGGQPIDLDMAKAISDFTMGIVSFMDSSFSAYRLNVSSNEQPNVAQILKVKWRFAGTILAVIPFIHFLTLAAVILWANKAIIKDDSHLAISKAYHSLLSHMGDQGCLLRGDEIVALLENPSVAYGWRASEEPGEADLMHVDVFARGRDLPREESRFREGWYNGASDTSCAPPPTDADSRLRRRYRDFDAAEYF